MLLMLACVAWVGELLHSRRPASLWTRPPTPPPADLCTLRGRPLPPPSPPHTHNTPTPSHPRLPAPPSNLQVFAPFVDATLFPTPRLLDFYEATGQRWFTLAFITADLRTKVGGGWVGGWFV